jgi:hypothetical protein
MRNKLFDIRLQGKLLWSPFWYNSFLGNFMSCRISLLQHSELCISLLEFCRLTKNYFKFCGGK